MFVADIGGGGAAVVGFWWVANRGWYVIRSERVGFSCCRHDPPLKRCLKHRW